MLSLAGAGAAAAVLPAPDHAIAAGVALGLGGWATLRARAEPPVLRLGGYAWSAQDFCRGWLITGDTGSGKTLSGLNALLHQIFQRVPRWGGLCIDDKGVYHETLQAMARHYGRERDLRLLRITAPGGPPSPHRFNLVGDRRIPWETYGKLVVDTAIALGQNRDQSFFQKQAQDHIARALQTLALLGYDVSLENACQLLLNPDDLHTTLRELTARGSAEARALLDYFDTHYLRQPAEQWGGVQATIGNYLQPFLQSAVAEVFCRDSTFELSDLDRGQMICLAIPQPFATERRYVCTFLKTLFYLHALRRFDRPQAERRHDNLLILWADEAQQFVTDARDGLSDHNVVDRLREARCAVVMATQSSTSFIPPLGEAKARVLTLNLRNRIIFKAADEADARASAEYLGQRKRRKLSWSYGRQGRSTTFSEEEVPKIPAYELRSLRQHRAVVVHCEQGFHRRVLPPRQADGTVPPWFRRWGVF
jgi:hypothetical protein